MLTETCPAATAAAPPLELVPGVNSWFLGLVVSVGSCTANSEVLFFPIIVAPAALIFEITRASKLPRVPGQVPQHCHGRICQMPQVQTSVSLAQTWCTD
jgi:hypothetical protein